MKQPRFNKKFVIGTVALLCVISLGAGAAAYPKIHSLVHMRRELVRGEGDFNLFREAALSVETFRVAEQPIVDTLLRNFDARLPAGEQIPELIGDIRHAGREAGIENMTIVTNRPSRMEIEDERLARCDEGHLHRVPVNLSGTGTYRGLAALLAELATGRRLILAESLRIEKHERIRSMVRFSIEAEAFCFLPSGEDDSD